ncbi:MAG: hypothetical protein HY749_04220 [Gammaproteobacteria bacterium]|nr:hypothetical protein [Gammaproteobacteria bacterium]MBI5614976.1 hypothetical protein [Gammaproteobacteria bacterium]
MKTIRILPLTLVLSAIAVPGWAADGAVAEQRAANQERRIEQGEASGALTQHEAQRLERRQQRLENDIDAATADGKVTGAERRHLRREENRNSKAIARKKHNLRTQ